MRRTAREMEPPAVRLNEEQHIDGFQPEGVDGEEITRQDGVFVVVEEWAPAPPVLHALGCGRHVLALQDHLHGRAPNRIPKLAQLTLNFAIAPARMLLRKTDDHRRDIQ